MKILYVCHRIPYPPNKGDKIRSFHQIRHLSRRHEVHLFALADHAGDLAHVEVLRRFCRTVEVRLIKPLLNRLSALSALFGSDPMTLSYFRSAALRRAVAEAAGRTAFDVAVAYSSGMIPYVSNLGIPWVVDFVDLDSQKWLQYAAASAPPLKWLFAREGRRLFDLECSAAEQAEASIFVTPQESAELLSCCSPRRLEAVSLGVDLDYYPIDFPPEESLKQREGPLLVFVGMMDYRPNVEAAERLARRVLPLVESRFPGAAALIVGAHPARRVRALHDGKRIIVTGRVTDPRPYLRAAAAAVVPLSIARGIQTKVLEAMALGVPVVLTPQALQGVGATPGRDCLASDHDEGLAEAVVSLVRDRGRAQSLAAAARKFVEEKFAWPDKLERYETILEEAAGAPRIRAKRAVPNGA